MFGNWGDLKKAATSAVSIASSVAKQAAVVARDIAEDLTSFKALKDYKLAGHVATAGPASCWKIFVAVSKKPGALFPEVAVWILDKKVLVDLASRAGNARGFDHFFEQQRRGCSQLMRLKHPGIVKLLEPLEETGSQMVFVTEPVFGSLSNVLTAFRDVPTAGEDRVTTRPSPLELKYALMHLAETLQFLHQDAGTVHCNVNPETVVVTGDGSYKLAGLAFAAAADFGVGSGGAAATGVAHPFEYTSSQPPMWEEVLRPPLPYTAPELVAGSLSSSDVRITAAVDVFSLAALAYELVAGKQALPVGASAAEYRARLPGLPSVDTSAVPPQLQATLRAMLAQSPSMRPNAAAFASCQWFQEDVLLRALRFLDTMLQREVSQKAAFLKDLGNFYSQFDDRLLRHKVLPPIVQEMRSEVVALTALPVVLSIMGRMTPADFEASGILPVLRPVFESADGEMQLALIRNVAVFYRLMPGEAVTKVVVPLMLRACDSPNHKAQEEVLKNLHTVALELDYTVLRNTLAPKVVAMALRTTSALVRSAALALLSLAVPRLDREAAEQMIGVCAQITAVDRSTGTALAVLRLGDAISRHHGAEMTAQHVLPLLCPLLVSPALDTARFATAYKVVQEMLVRIQEKRAPQGLPAVDASAALAAAGAPTGANGAEGDGAAATWDQPTPSSSRPAAAAAGRSAQASPRAPAPPPKSTHAAPLPPWPAAPPAPAAAPAAAPASTASRGWGSGGGAASAGGVVAAPPAGLAAGPAPDIFSDTLLLGAGGGGAGAGASQPLGGMFGGLSVSASPAPSPPVTSDPFGSLPPSTRGPSGAPSVPALQPPPFPVTGVPRSPAAPPLGPASADPFRPSSSSSSTSAGGVGVAAAAGPGFDPFTSLAAAPATQLSASSGDPFAALARGPAAAPSGWPQTGVGSQRGQPAAGVDPFAVLGGGVSMSAARKPPPPQAGGGAAWGAAAGDGDGSLI